MLNRLIPLVLVAVCGLSWLPAWAQLVGGLEWSTQSPPDQRMLLNIAASPQTVVIVGAEGLILRSSDGENWQIVSSPIADELSVVTYFGGLFVVGGRSQSILVSYDEGLSWQQRQLPPADTFVLRIQSIVYFDNAWLLSDSNGRILRSIDLVNFEEIAPTVPFNYRYLIMANSNLLVSWNVYPPPSDPLAPPFIERSTDGAVWHHLPHPLDQRWNRIIVDPQRLLVSGRLEVGEDNWIAATATTSDGDSWEIIPTASEVSTSLLLLGASSFSYLARDRHFGDPVQWSLLHSNDLAHWDQVLPLATDRYWAATRWRGGWMAISRDTIVRGQMPPAQAVPLGSAWAWTVLALLLMMVALCWGRTAR